MDGYASDYLSDSKLNRHFNRTGRKDLQGKSENYVEDELEGFLTRYNVEISKTTGEERDELQRRYSILCSKRNTVDASDRNAILGLLDDVRKLSRTMADIQMKNKLSV